MAKITLIDLYRPRYLNALWPIYAMVLVSALVSFFLAAAFSSSAWHGLLYATFAYYFYTIASLLNGRQRRYAAWLHRRIASVNEGNA